MLRKTIIALSCVSLMLPAFAFAETSTTTSTTMVTDLQQTLRFGDKGDLVKILQAILASDQTVFPEGTITGTFGPLTRNAVKRFQKKNGLEQIGNVGPRTLMKLNQKLSSTSLAFEASSTNETDDMQRNRMGSSTNGHREGKRLCIPPGHMIAPGWQKHNGESKFPPCKGMPKDMRNSTTSDNSAYSDHPEEKHTGSSTDDTPRSNIPTDDRRTKDVDDRIIMCPNPWSTASSSMHWPKGIPCPTNNNMPPSPSHKNRKDEHSSCSATSVNASGTAPCPPPSSHKGNEDTQQN